MRRSIYVILPLFIALALRLYPTLSSGLPFSTDAWFPIRNTELLIEHTPVHLDDGVFDGYNNYWPANSLFGAVLSQVTGLKPIDAMAIGIPLAGALTIPIFYALVRKASQNQEIAFIASVLLATAFPYALFTAGVTKETYANPLYILLIFLFLHPTMNRPTRTLLFTITSTTLVLAHHLTPLLAAVILASLTLSTGMRRASQGKTNLMLASVLAAIAALYFWLYAHRGFEFTIATSDWLSAASYQVIALTLALYPTLKHPHQTRAKAALKCTIAVALPLLLMEVIMKRPLVSGAPILPTSYLLYASPFVVAAPLVILGLEGNRETHHTAPIFWLTTVLGLEGYAILSGSELAFTLAYRAVDFLWPPLAALCAIGLHRLYAASGEHRAQRLAKSAAVAAILAIAALNFHSVYAAVSLGERYLGYFWLYKAPEHEAGGWIATVANGQVVAGDVKVFSLVKGYFNANVDVAQGLLYLTGKRSLQPQVLFIYDQMFKNGYVLYGGYSMDLPEKWAEKTFDLNLVYSNGFVKLHAGPR